MKPSYSTPIAFLAAIAAFAIGTTLSAQTVPATADQSPGKGTLDVSNAKDQVDGETVQLATFEVTGTQIRGVEPTGTNVVSFSTIDISNTGETDTNRVLAHIPQVTSAFNLVPVLNTNDPGNSMVRPQLRNFTTGSGNSATLILIDGHRGVNSGSMSSPDPGVLPPLVLERIDIVPDGGSAIYGSDAVTGVINFVTKSRFDGVKTDAHYGFAQGYHEWDANLIAGKDWGKGGYYLAYSHSMRDAILGSDRSWYHATTPSQGYSTNGTVVINGITYGYPGYIRNTVTQVDSTDDVSFVPEEKRDSVFGVFNQKINDFMDVDIRAFYTKRTNIFSFNGANANGTITSTNPYFTPIGNETSHAVRFNLGRTTGQNILEETGITATITTALGKDWQSRTLLNWGHSYGRVNTPTLDQVALAAGLAGTTKSTAINPYNALTSDPAVLAGLIWSGANNGKQTMQNAREVVDGSLFTLPGGAVRLAAGAEYSKDESSYYFKSDRNSVVTNSPERTIKAVFGELLVPLVGPRNAVPGIHKLVLAAAARRDDYSDFGTTTNPKLGLTYEPADWISLRANWGKSFIAPSVADTLGASDTRAILFGPIGTGNLRTQDLGGTNAGGVPYEQLPWIILAGGNANLKPQTAKTSSAGFDFRPPSIKGLTVSMTYYTIDTRNEIANLFASVLQPLGFQALYQPQYSPWVILNPTQAFTTAYLSSIPTYVNAGGGNSVNDIYHLNGGSNGVYVIQDWRRNNLSLTKQDGLDFSFDYKRRANFGDWNVNIGGTYLLGRDVATAPGAPVIDALKSPGMNRLNLAASVGANVDNLYASATMRYLAGYDIFPAVGGQTKVDPYATFDLFFTYDLKGTDWRKGVTLTFSVANVFDSNPPSYNGGQGYTNGSTLGRLFSMRVSKKF